MKLPNRVKTALAFWAPGAGLIAVGASRLDSNHAFSRTPIATAAILGGMVLVFVWIAFFDPRLNVAGIVRSNWRIRVSTGLVLCLPVFLAARLYLDDFEFHHGMLYVVLNMAMPLLGATAGILRRRAVNDASKSASSVAAPPIGDPLMSAGEGAPTASIG